MTTADELRAAVAAALAAGRLDLAVADLVGGAAQTFLGRFLAGGRLVLTGSTSVLTLDGVSLTGTGAAAPLLAMQVTAVLASDGTQVTLVLDAVGDQSWAFADNLPGLRGSFFDGRRFDRPTWHLDTAAVQQAETVDPGSGSASFTGVLVIDTRLVLIDLLFAGADRTVHGDVRMVSGLPGSSRVTGTVADILLDGPTGGTADLGLFRVEQLRYGLFSDPRFNYYLVDFDVRSYLRIVGAVPVTTGTGRHDVVLSMDLAGEAPEVVLKADFRQLGSIGLADVAALTGPGTLAVPFDVDLTAPVTLTELAAVLQPGGGDLVRSVSAMLQTTRSWTIVPGLITLQQVDVLFRIANPLGAARRVGGSVTGLVAVGANATLVLSVDFASRTLSGTLREGDPPLLLREVFEQFIGGDAGHLPDLGVPTFDFSLTLPSDGQPLGYDGQLVVDADWVITDVLTLVQVGFTLDHQVPAGESTAVTRFRAQADLAIARVPVTVSADYDPAPEKQWTFAGETGKGVDIPIGRLADDLAQRFGGLALPAPISALTVSNLGARFTTGTKALFLTAEAKFPIDTAELDLTVTIDTANRLFAGTLAVTVPTADGDLELDFAVKFSGQPQDQRLVAGYTHPVGAPLPTVHQLVQALSPAAAAFVPEGLSVDLRDALVAVQTTSAGDVAVIGADLAITLDLTRLPLIGERFAGAGTFGVEPLRLLAVSGPLTTVELAGINGLLPAGIAALPADADLARGFVVDAVLKLGSLTQPVTVPTVPPATSTSSSTSSSTAATPAGKPAPPTSDNVVWYKVQRSFGPVTFDRVGFSYLHPPGEDARLAVLLDGSLAVAGLVLSLQGLTVGLSLARPTAVPSFGLRGLGVSYKSGDVEVTGAFLADTATYQGATYPAYSGKAVLRTPQFSLGAIGSYVQLPQGPSLFVYAFLDYPLGGPPMFFVRGLAAGFGYNRRLIAPELAAIPTFPLVAEAAGSRTPNASLADELQALRDYLPPSVGDFFLAVGVRFTSFQMIDSVLLLSVSFGHRFELDLLGLSTLVLPSPDAATAGVTPIAQVQLALRATLIPDQGFFAVTAQLTQNSFLLSKACQLTGGFALAVWFGTEHNGDFVLSVGGYHPRFALPGHYPAVPRLGFTWQVSPQLKLKGSAYYAMTPAALMAGGSFTATYVDDAAQAWFDASMDFLIGWKPYHYQASLRVRVGASYTFSFFGTHTIRVDVSAGVELWGPEFSGTAAIDLGVYSFTVAFGAGAPAAIAPISWARFRESFLPSAAELVTVVLQGGAVGGGGAAASGDLGVVNPIELRLFTDSALPSGAGRSGPAGPAGRPTTDRALPTGTAATAFGIAPLGLSAATGGVTSTHRIEIRRADGTPMDDHFSFDPVIKNLPVAMWGDQLQPSLSGPPVVPGLLTGYAVRPLPPVEPADPPSLSRAALAPTALSVQDDAFNWLGWQPFIPSGDDPARREHVIADTVTAAGPSAARAALVAVLLGPQQPIDLTGFDPGDFLEAPLTGAAA